MNLDQLRLEQLHGNQRELAETIGIEAYKRLLDSDWKSASAVIHPETAFENLQPQNWLLP